MEYAVGDTLNIGGIEAIIIFDAGVNCNWGRYLAADKNYDLDYYFSNNVPVFSKGTHCTGSYKIGEGKTNTEKYISSFDSIDSSHGVIYQAFSFRNRYSSDWFIPNMQEILLVYNAKSLLSGLRTTSTSRYWATSDSYSGEGEDIINMSTGGTGFRAVSNTGIYTRMCSYVVGDPATKQVTITSTTSNTNIYYTTDKSIPVEDSMLYSSSLNIEKGKTVKAKGFASGYFDSEVATKIIE